jgi:hypothetical protein
MATFDMTSSDTAGVGANVLAVPTVVGNAVRTIEAILDIDAMIAAGATIAAESVMLAGGAEIMKSFTASCTCNIDFAGGDDIIDGAALDAAAGTYLVKGSAGEANIVNTGAASTYAAAALALVGAADTIDVVIADAAAATGRLRVYAVIADVSSAHTEAAVAARDLV